MGCLAVQRLAVQGFVVLSALGWATVGVAQNQPAVCVPGTPFCASADGRGGVQINANGSVQASPSGVNASGQANGNANANAIANGNVNVNGDGNGNGDGNVNGAGNGTGTGGPPNYYGGGRRRYHYDGRFGVGVTLCPIARIGVWSGFKAGGCVAVSFRFEAVTFEMESQLLYGGTTHAFDWTFPMSFLVPLANDSSLFEGPYLRFGGSPVGATFAKRKDGGSFVRFGLFAGAGYELRFNRALTWRVIDARLSFDMGTRRAMDQKGHWVDLGLQVGSGLVF
jgi:hypothetical protein